MLIAITLLSTVLALLGGTFFQSDEFVKRTEQKIESRKEIRNLMTIFKRDLSSAVFLPNLVRRSKPGDAEYDSGIKGRRNPEESPRLDSLFLHVNLPSMYRTDIEPNRDPELHEVGYFLGVSDIDGVYRLYRREDYYVDAKFDFPDQNPYRSDEYLDTNKSITHYLVDNVMSFKVQYLETLDEAEIAAAQNNGWVDEWDSNQKTNDARLPFAVRITLVFPLIDPADISSIPDFTLDNPAYVQTDTFEVVLRWKLGDDFEWSF